MPTPPHLQLPEELRELVKAQLHAERRQPGFLGEDPDDALPPVDEEEESLFADHDAVRGHGRGVYVFDEAEAQSRSVRVLDTRDPDEGPIPMPPADGSVEAVEFRLQG